MTDQDRGAGRREARRIETARAAAARQLVLSRAALAAERAARLLWPIWALLAGFAGLALLGAPQALPFALHLALLLALAGALIRLGLRLARGWRAPGRHEAVARLDAGAPERPVAALSDAMALGAEPLWRAHRLRMAEAAARLRADPPDLRVAAQDRYALRHVGALLLGAGLIAFLAGDGAVAPIDALTPDPGGPVAAAPAPGLELWAAPPAHTGRAPVYLTDRAGETVALPRDSVLSLRVFDSAAAPLIRSDLDAPAPSGDPALGWRAQWPLTGDDALSVSVGGAALGAWRFTAIPDLPPEIAFAAPPSAALSGALQIAFAASDDYGLVGARAQLALDREAPAPVAGADRRGGFGDTEFPLPLPFTGAATRVEETAIRDLSAHPFAGLPVALTLIAEDAAGQTGRAQTRMILPQRSFSDPLARALVEQRRDLVWSPGLAPRIHAVLKALTAWPEDIFDDYVAYLATRAAIHRLGYALAAGRVEAELESVAELLWRAALRIEDGDLSDAERRLRDLQRRLSEALENGASAEELAELMRQLRAAMAAYMRQLAEDALRDMQRGQAPPQEGQTLSQQDLQQMLDQLEQALQDGAREAARRMLNQLAQMLENLRMAQPGASGQGQGQGMGGGMGGQPLQDMIGRQQGLADRSFEALRQGQGQGQAGSGGLGGIARDQQALRRDLQGLRGGAEGAAGAEALERADKAMRGAEDALERGDADTALQRQAEALDALREGAQAQAQAQAPGTGGREGPGSDGRETDPFGRPAASTGPTDGQSVRVPESAGVNRARALLDELRRRAGERERPAYERDYLNRLMDRF